MSHLRTFQQIGALFVDVYDTNSEGKPVSFQGPREFLTHLRWERAQPTEPIDPARTRWTQERTRLLHRLRRANPIDLQIADFVQAARTCDPRLGQLVEASFPTMRRAWRKKDPVRLAHAASAILSLNPTQLSAASILATLFSSTSISAFERLQISSCVAAAVRLGSYTPAMAVLERTILAPLRDDGLELWGPHMYPCIRHLLELDRRSTLDRCRTELATRDNWHRHTLINELGERPNSDVLRLLIEHLALERSPRIKIQIVRLAGDLLPESRRRRVLAAGLRDPSPSCRFLAAKALRLVDASFAHTLAASNMKKEPDELLANLLGQVVKFTKGRWQRPAQPQPPRSG